MESLSATSSTLVVRRHVVSLGVVEGEKQRSGEGEKKGEGQGGGGGGGTLLSRLTPGKFVYLAQITLPARKVSTLRMLIAMRCF